MRKALDDAATEMQTRWRCPAAGYSPSGALPADLAFEAAHVSRVTGSPPATTCPLACVERAEPWLLEITGAVSLAEWGAALTDTLGRDLTAADVAALTTLRRAQSDALHSDRRLDEADRAAEDAARAARDRP